MKDEEREVQEFPAGELAAVLDVPLRTIQYWLTKGELEGRQTFSGRWFVRVSSAREFIKRKGRDRGAAAARFDAYLDSKYPRGEATC